MRAARRVGAALGLLLGGGLIGLAAVALHTTWWGLALASLASLSVFWALPPRLWTLPAYAVGWWVPLLIAWQGRREGDYAVESSAYGYGLIVLATAVLCASVIVTTLKAPLRTPLRTTPPAAPPAPGSAPRGAR